LTYPERLLWSKLRSGRSAGLKFRRQQAIDQFVVDFYCPTAKLVVEIDGDSHAGRKAEDAARADFLRGHGLTVLRFSNDEVLRSTDAVVEEILRVASPYPHPAEDGCASP
jgi:very-short-patch-repair endonuclease